MNETVKVHLLGRDYVLSSSGDVETLQEAAQLVEEKFASVSTTVSVDTRDRQILAMLNLAGDYLHEKRRRLALELEQDELRKQNVSADIQKQQLELVLIDRIEKALQF
ncbi:cell division protein ZapA [Geopsychrobacter electrodiphilus]|uniref:cell division protein ZapA n=1 Tax=Geopsychrobacter electrodiphilus TaxID=225196 RepID=UPI00035E4A69|nr:cell division protein ZapA [Geopsychrobacter electrodiphilus]